MWPITFRVTDAYRIHNSALAAQFASGQARLAKLGRTEAELRVRRGFHGTALVLGVVVEFSCGRHGRGQRRSYRAQRSAADRPCAQSKQGTRFISSVCFTALR